MRASRQEQTGGAGVSHVKEKFQDINWGPIENTEHDLGVDLFVQVRDERRFDRGALVGVQVKAGDAKYFASPARNEAGEVTGWWYYEPDAEHFDDWVQHGLPHLLVLVTDGPGRTAYWVHVTTDKIARTGMGCKILVSASQRIDWDNFDALMTAATSAKASPDLQGSLYRAGPNAVPPARALRHALLAPRLIAPSAGRTGYDKTLSPEEAIALITGGRTQDLVRYTRKRNIVAGTTSPAVLNRDMVKASETSKDWRWRLFNALRAFALDGDTEPAVRLAAATAAAENVPVERRAAAAVVAATALMDLERWDQAAEVLAGAEARDDLLPVDHGWVLTHRAQVFVEQNDIAQARVLAAEALKTLSRDLDDVTARAIRAAAAAVLLSTSGLDGEGDEQQEYVTSFDTAVSWWRSGEVAAALDSYDDISFDSWSRSADIGAELSEESQERLSGAWLAAYLSGNRAAATWPLTIRLRHELQHQEIGWRDARCDEDTYSGAGTAPTASGAAARRIEAALDALRRHGQHEDLKVAVARLWAVGPAEPIRAALRRSVDQMWRRSTARAHIALLAGGGDLLEPETADKAAHGCLEVLADVPVFRQRVRPTFMEWHFIPKALRTVLPAATDTLHVEALELLLARMKADHPDREADLHALAVNIRSDVAARQRDRVRRAAVAQEGYLSALLLKKLSSEGDTEALVELRSRADAGNHEAVVALGAPVDLGELAARTLIGRDVEQCRRLVADARRGSFAPTAAVRNLLVMNLAFPDLADWDPVIEALFDPLVAPPAKADAVRILTAAIHVPDHIRAQVRQRLTARGPHAIASTPFLSARFGDIAAESFALAVAVGAVDNAWALRQVLTWLRGSAARRRGASEIVMALSARAESPTIQGALVMLTGDSQHQIRSAATAALIRGTAPGAHPEVEQAILAAASEEGCAVPFTVARVLARTEEAWTGRSHVRDLLSSHISARVRGAVADTSAST
ncbi:DUF4365 domain-containing protein [Micromonospora sp. KC606]|uniref:DUF4365 domain-containing protein n=1 Tax=Micromonospora sp. KC606 TaxID=2530379 RepID=UPI0014045684|nr:DUF4365 domain-containing protein [Micromonospora sp. KC606]